MMGPQFNTLSNRAHAAAGQDYGFAAFMDEVDTVLLGRATYEQVAPRSTSGRLALGSGAAACKKTRAIPLVPGAAGPGVCVTALFCTTQVAAFGPPYPYAGKRSVVFSSTLDAAAVTAQQVREQNRTAQVCRS